MIDTASLGSIILFWIAVGGCGLLAWPLAGLLFGSDGDRGYLAAKPLGWVIGAYAAWLVSAVGGIPFWRFGPAVGLVALCIVFVAFIRRPRPPLRIVRVLQWEAAFLAVFFFAVTLRAGSPEIAGLEKYMDFGFVNAALRTGAMPPGDPWWAGEPINYYYFGHVAAAWLIKLSGVPPDHGYNLMIGLLFAFSAVLSYRIVQGSLRRRSPRIAAVCGLTAAALVTMGGNFHSVLYDPFRPLSPTTYERSFYYPDSTRFIGFDPQTDDRAFTEMPSYGFQVADLHAHLLNLPTAFLIVFVLVRLVQRELSSNAVGGVRLLEAVILGFLFAVAAMSNSWDTISYGILLGLAGLMLWIFSGGWRLRHLLTIAVGIAGTIGLALVLSIPFFLNFEPMASGLRWSDGQTPLWQLAILYGHLALPFAVILLGLVTAARRDPVWVSAAMLAGAAVILIALPEIAYVKDIYGEDHRRANTMFKFTFQAQPLGFLASVLLLGLLLNSRRAAVSIAGLVMAIPILATLSYGEEMHGHLLRTLSTRSLSLDGTKSVDPTDRPILDWLRAQPPSRRLLLVEADGDSYGNAGRLSALSGVPTLLGWRGHEWLWRGDHSMVYARSDEIASFYASPDRSQACAFVNSHDVTHVAIGHLEHRSFPELNRQALMELGPVIVGSGDAVLIEVEPANCT